MDHDHVLKTLNFDCWPKPKVGGLRAKNLLPCCCFRDMIPFNLICYMTMFWKSGIFDLLNPTPGSGSGGSMQNICDHVAAFVIPFNWICNMTLFLKKEFWPFTPSVKGGGSAGKVFATMLPYFVLPIKLISNISIFWKSWIWPNDLIPKTRGGSSVKILATMLLHSWFPLVWYVKWKCS